MTLTAYPDIEQGTEEWLALRRGMVTASVVGKLLTPMLKVADNETSRGIVAGLVAERITGWTDPTYTNEDIWRGVELEPVARDWYSENRAPVTEMGYMVYDAGHWQLGYSPDGLVGDDGLIEVKAPRQKTHLLTVLNDEVPAVHMAQIQAGLFVSGRRWCDFISICEDMPPFVKRVLPDEKWFDAITDACITFERAAQQMTSDYLARTKGLMPTERRVREEITF